MIHNKLKAMLLAVAMACVTLWGGGLRAQETAGQDLIGRP